MESRKKNTGKKIPHPNGKRGPSTNGKPVSKPKRGNGKSVPSNTSGNPRRPAFSPGLNHFYATYLAQAAQAISLREPFVAEDGESGVENESPRTTPDLIPQPPELTVGQRFFRSTGFNSSNTRELVLTMDDYFDWTLDTETILPQPTPLPIRDYNINIVNPFFTSSQELSAGLVIRRCTVYVLPKASNNEVATSSFVFQAIVPARQNLEGTTFLEERKVGVVNTIVKPDFNINWTRVATFNYLTLFRDSNIVPVTFTGSPSSKIIQTLFRFSLVNPDDGSPLDQTIQVRVHVEATAPIPPVTFWDMGPSSGFKEWDRLENNFTPSSTFVMTQLKKIQNSR